MNLTSYEHALSLWKDAGLTDLQNLLDASISKIKELESKSLDSRKLLSTQTKRVKKLPNEEKISESSTLIKQYQKEIDALTTRSTFSEEVLINLYEKLMEQPDPSVILESMIDGLKKSTANLTDLKAENENLSVSLSKYGDYESLKARLHDLEQSSAKTLTMRLKAKEQELNSKWEEKQRNWEGREQELSNQLEIFKNTNSALEKKIGAKLEVSGDDTTSAVDKTNSSVHLELLSQELESAHVRIMSLENRNEELNGMVAKLSSAEEHDSNLNEKEQKLKQLESENARLIATLDVERKTLKNKLIESSEELKSTLAETQACKTELETLRRKMKGYSDYDKIKQELNAMKKIEFGASDDIEDEVSGDIEDVNNSFRQANQKLQNNLTKVNMEKNKYLKEAQELREKVNSLEGKLNSLRALNEKLETDIERIDDVTNQFTDTQSMMSGVTRQMNNRHATVDRLSPTSSIIGIPEEKEMDSFTNSSSILPIVTKQRDRFRTRNLELETQLKKSVQEHNKLKAELNKMKIDNSSLYEKVRILSSYTNNNITGVSTDLETPFSAEYEEALHPLAEFKQKELSRYERKRMSPFERLFLSLAKIILANKTTRMVFMLYCVGLHGLLIMMIMYITNIPDYDGSHLSTVQSKIIKTNDGV